MHIFVLNAGISKQPWCHLTSSGRIKDLKEQYTQNQKHLNCSQGFFFFYVTASNLSVKKKLIELLFEKNTTWAEY